ncbi:MAG: DUF4340 domain-containing protein [Polyangiaceae bacterium]
MSTSTEEPERDEPETEEERASDAPPERPKAPAPRGFLRKHWLNLGIVALAIAATLYFFVFDKKNVTSNEADARKKMVFPAWRENDLTGVTMKRGDDTIELVSKPAKNGGKSWDVRLNGTLFTGDDQAIDKLLSSLQYAEARREVPKESVDRKQFGLDAPVETVDVAMGDLTFHLAIGASGAGDTEVYASVGERVFTISPMLAKTLAPSADDLRSTRFVPYFSTDLVSIKLEGEGGERSFERAPWSGGRGSGFRFAGGGVRVDGDVLNHVFTTFTRMRAEAVLTDAEAEAASTPRVTVTLVPREGDRVVMALGGECPSKAGQIVAVRREPSRLAICVPQGLLEAFTRPKEAFEDTHVLGTALDEVVEVKVVDGDKRLEIARSGNGFKMRAPADKVVDGDRGNALLGEMLLARGELGDAATSGEPIKIRVLSEGGLTPDGKEARREEEVSLYRPAEKGGQCIAVRAEDERKLIVPCSALHTFAANDLLVRGLEILGERAERVTALEVTSPGKTQSVRRKESSWELLAPTGKGLLADDGLVGELAESLARLTTSRWIAEADDGSFGLAEPRLTLTAKLAASEKAEARTVKLSIGSKTDDGSYGALDTSPGVFIVPKALEDAASRWLVSRATLRIALDTAEKISIHGDDGKVIELVREGKELKSTSSGPSANQVAATVGAALEDLLPIAAVTVGPPEDHQGLKAPVMTIAVKSAGGEYTIAIGAGDMFERTSIHYARRSGVDATYAVPQSVVRQLLDALEASSK